MPTECMTSILYTNTFTAKSLVFARQEQIKLSQDSHIHKYSKNYALAKISDFTVCILTFTSIC